MGRLFFLTQPGASVESSLLRAVDLSCSQHVLFGLEIHKSFDCFSLPGMSFQSDSFRAIPQPGFVIYISTIVWSPDFEERGNRFYPDWPHPLVSRDKRNIQSLSRKKKKKSSRGFTSTTCVPRHLTYVPFCKLYQELRYFSQIPLNLSSSSFMDFYPSHSSKTKVTGGWKQQLNVGGTSGARRSMTFLFIVSTQRCSSHMKEVPIKFKKKKNQTSTKAANFYKKTKNVKCKTNNSGIFIFSSTHENLTVRLWTHIENITSCGVI